MKVAAIIQTICSESPRSESEIVLRTIQLLGLEVGKDGEVYNPAPAPALHEMQRPNGARWQGSGKRRRR